MKTFFERAVRNITKHGDTDIFPFPVENHVFFDNPVEVIDRLIDINGHFAERLVQYPPSNEGALAPVNYVGFRWATQLDPLWNAYFLGIVLSIAEDIEKARIPKSEATVFSYRYAWDDDTANIFDPDHNWRAFMEQSMKIAQEKKFVVVCDISEFYPRLSHHRLENAIKHLDIKSDVPFKIKEFLSNFSGTNSFGIPIGGPAARILSELVLNQIDRLLNAKKISFCRFADDYHIFSDSYEDAFASLVFLSDRLLRNQGLQLQKSKTRIMSGQEFISTSPLKLNDEDDEVSEMPATLEEQSKSLLRFSLRFDPYSPTADEDYESLRSELEKFDIMALLKSELSKTRIHISLSKKIIATIRFISPPQRDDAVLSLIANPDLLYPVYANVLMVAKAVFSDLEEKTRIGIISRVRQLITDGSHVCRVELNLGYAIRLLSCSHSPESEQLLISLYDTTTSLMLRRDIILALAKWHAWYWLSDLRTRFRTLSPPERRAFVVASFVLKDEGKHWRDHIGPELTPFEKLIMRWAGTKTNLKGWEIPL
jgi:hypothetical protein